MSKNIFLTIILLIASSSVLAWFAKEIEKGLKHRRRMARIKLAIVHRKAREKVELPARSLEELRREITALRDTTTQYDMSFDTALQRLESRLSHLEKQSARSDQPLHQTVHGQD